MAKKNNNELEKRNQMFLIYQDEVQNSYSLFKMFISIHFCDAFLTDITLSDLTD